MGKRKLHLICEGNYAPGWLYFKRNAYKSWLLCQWIRNGLRIDWKTWSKAKLSETNKTLTVTALTCSQRCCLGTEGARRGVMAAIAVKQLLAGSAALLFLLTRRDLTGLTIKTNVAMSWRWRYVWRLKKQNTHTHVHWEKQQQKKAGLLFFVELFSGLGFLCHKTEKKNTIKMLICMLCAFFSASLSCLIVCRLTRASNVEMMMAC